MEAKNKRYLLSLLLLILRRRRRIRIQRKSKGQNRFWVNPTSMNIMKIKHSTQYFNLVEHSTWSSQLIFIESHFAISVFKLEWNWPLSNALHCIQLFCTFFLFPLLMYCLWKLPYEWKLLFLRKGNMRAYIVHMSLCKWPRSFCT